MPKATKRKKTNSTKKNSVKKTTGKKVNNSKKKNDTNNMLPTVLLVISVCICVLLYAAIFGVGGSFGDKIAASLTKNFGFVVYLFPVVLYIELRSLIYLFTSSISDTVRNKLIKRIILILITYFSLGLLISILDNVIKTRISGLLFDNIFNILQPRIGVIGVLVADLAILTICFFIATGNFATSEEKIAKREKLAAMRREENELKRKKREEQLMAERLARHEEKKKQISEAPIKERSTGKFFDNLILKPKNEEKEQVKEKSVEPSFSDSKNKSFGFTMPAKDGPVISEGYDELGVNPKDINISGLRSPAEEINNNLDNHVINNEEPIILGKAINNTSPNTKNNDLSGEAPKEELEDTSKIIKDGSGKVSKVKQKPYKTPPINLLDLPENSKMDSKEDLLNTANKLVSVLASFGVNVKVTNISQGPVITRYELQPEIGVKVSKILSLQDDIKLNLAAKDIRIEAPIPGKAAVGIELQNKTDRVVSLREIVDSKEFKKSGSKLGFALGEDLSGKIIISDINKMPHLLIAGQTGSGKSVCINTIIMSLIYKYSPKQVRLLMIDPKVVELSVYNGIPHLLSPVVTNPTKAIGVLQWAVKEMLQRFKKFEAVGSRDLKGYNDKIKGTVDEEGNPVDELPQIVIIVDELSDLMMVAGNEVEDAIIRLTQLARAAGLHLIIATQRPSVNVITGLIKANVPSRIAFAVSSGVDSRTILDMNGAEKLLGKGDMLYFPTGIPKPIRIQGAFVSDKEVERVTEYLKENYPLIPSDDEGEEDTTGPTGQVDLSSFMDGFEKKEDDDKDPYYAEAGRTIISSEKASIGMLQRKFRIGFNRAARIMDQLNMEGVVGGEEGTKPRKILMDLNQFEESLKK
ncbi:MAG: DNA translocase FtsK [Lachnospiraceae bacterium]|jgi:S-DNA-T family DNA segregation ATPase FtsK/SpoIIIE|nr:DNA translocase FtsK [Lachnospiraceae bacterium]